MYSNIDNKEATYELGLGLGYLPNDDVFLIVSSSQYLIAFESKAGARDLSAAADGVIVFFLHCI